MPNKPGIKLKASIILYHERPNVLRNRIYCTFRYWRGKCFVESISKTFLYAFLEIPIIIQVLFTVVATDHKSPVKLTESGANLRQ